MPALVTAILTFLGSWLGRFAASEAARWLAWKVLISAVMFVILPLVLYNLMCDITSEIIQYAQAHASGGSGNVAITLALSGLAGWVAECLRFQECISVLMSALAIRWTLNMIPFSRV